MELDAQSWKELCGEIGEIKGTVGQMNQRLVGMDKKVDAHFADAAKHSSDTAAHGLKDIRQTLQDKSEDARSAKSNLVAWLALGLTVISGAWALYKEVRDEGYSRRPGLGAISEIRPSPSREALPLGRRGL